MTFFYKKFLNEKKKTIWKLFVDIIVHFSYKKKNEIKITYNHMIGYYCKFISFSFKFLVLPNNGMKINNHSYVRFLN